jgi:hypothetical protein
MKLANVAVVGLVVLGTFGIAFGWQAVSAVGISSEGGGVVTVGACAQFNTNNTTVCDGPPVGDCNGSTLVGTLPPNQCTGSHQFRGDCARGKVTATGSVVSELWNPLSTHIFNCSMGAFAVFYCQKVSNGQWGQKCQLINQATLPCSASPFDSYRGC